MNCNYSGENSIELYGSLGEFVDLRDAIVDFTESEDQSWAYKLDCNIETGHTQKRLSQIFLKKTNDMLCIAISGRQIIISGKSGHFWPLSSYFHFDETDTFPEKNELLYHENHNFLKSSSLSMIVCISKGKFGDVYQIIRYIKKQVWEGMQIII
ncbi:hypothetical protein ACFLZM_05860 [Thermodesulfobacteriota bacterium]